MGKRARTNPLHGFTDAVSEWNRMRHLGAHGYGPAEEQPQRTYATAWIPTIDIFARGADLTIHVSLAGVRREDVDIAFSNGVLTISGERRSKLNEEGLHFYVRERYYGAFRRIINLPEGVRRDEISATFEDNVLEITIRGAAVAPEPWRIEIDEDRSS